jgi:DNA polymerase-1
MPTCYLIDGSAYIYRAFFALPALSNSRGLQTNAVYGFTTMLMKILRERAPDCLAITFDEKGPTHRHEEFKEYKAHRPPMPEGMQAQVPYIHRMVEAFGIPVVRKQGYEADDLIGTLAKQAEAAGFEVVIVTGDKDMLQLVTPAVRIYDPVKDKSLGEAECREKFGVEPARVVEVMGLMGDATDNIPGVKGIGEKTAMKLIAEFGTIENLLEHVDDVKPARTQALLREQAEQARLSRKLATIRTDCPVEFDAKAFTTHPPDPERLAPVLREMEFSRLLKTITFSPAHPGASEPAFSRGASGSAPPGEALGGGVDTIKDENAAKRFADHMAKGGLAGLHLVLDGAGVGAEVRGLALSAPDGTTVFASRLFGPLKDLLADTKVLKAAHDLKPALLGLHRAGVETVEPAFDTMIAAYLLNPNKRDHSLGTVALEALGYHLGTGRKEQPEDAAGDLFASAETTATAVPQAAEAAAVVARLAPVLQERLSEQGSLSLFEEIEMPLVPVLAEIERNGFGLDIRVLHEQGKELERELENIMGDIVRLAGQEFNVNSPKQLATVLFEKLGLKPIRKTKTGYSTDEDTLTQLATQHELPLQILNYRSLSKLKSTYVDALPALVHPETHRLHTSLNQTVAATGRLSSTEPNLQNIPIKGGHGFRIREAFVASRGHTLLCADYSQIEPRILAHLSDDPKLKKVFEQGEDIHTATAVEIFKLLPENITREMRRIAKTVVFGIVYGISPFGLAQNIGVSQTDAKKYIDTYFERYAGVKAFIDRTIAEAKRQGYTTTITGRRRPIPELQSSDPAQRGYGERQAVNSPIQGSAADVIKVAMIDVNKKLHAELPTTKMILQVHDELIFEVPEKDLNRARHLVKDEMEGVGPRLGLSVPLKVELGTGHNWREAHP